MGLSVHSLWISVLTLIAGILILIYPRLLNHLIAIYLCLIGLWDFVG